MKRNNNELSQAAKAARARYYRERYRADPEAARTRQNKYWERKALAYELADKEREGKKDA